MRRTRTTGASVLDIREDEFCTFLGPSGSGKTTRLRMIAGFERPDEVRVDLGGRDVTDLLSPHDLGANVEYGVHIGKVRH